MLIRPRAIPSVLPIYMCAGLAKHVGVLNREKGISRCQTPLALTYLTWEYMDRAHWNPTGKTFSPTSAIEGDTH